MEKLKDEEQAKYLLADILPVCGECKNYKRHQQFKDNYDTFCTLHNIEVSYYTKSCQQFYPSDV